MKNKTIEVLKPKLIINSKSRFKNQMSVRAYLNAVKQLAAKDFNELVKAGITPDMNKLLKDWANDLRLIWDYENDRIKE